MSILSRIEANGGAVIRDEWRFSLRRGRLTSEALMWLRARWSQACLEAWPPLDTFEERAAIMEYDGGMPREEAERAAYREVAGC